MVQFSHLYMTTGKTIALTRWTFVCKVMSLLFNTLSRLVIDFLPRSKHLLISWLQSPSAVIFSSVQFSHSVVSDSLWPHELQHARPLCPSPTPGVHSYSHPSSRWCHPAISSSVVPFSSCPQSLPASESFPMSQLFASGGQSIGVSASASVLPMNTRTDLLPDGLVGPPCSPRDSQESSPTPQFKSINSSLLSFLYSPTLTSIHDHRKNHSFDSMDVCWQSNVSTFEYAV